MIANKTRAERGLPPYVSPKKAWDVTVEHAAPEVLDAKEPSTRKQRRVMATARRVGSRKRQKMATDRWFRERHQRHSALGIARVYLDTDGAHERSPEVARNATARVHREAEAISKRDGIPWTEAIKVVEGDLLNLAHSAGLR